MRLKLTLAYDGAPFGGYQIQPNADTIQGRIEEALAIVAKEPVKLIGSGRTDAGVHAQGQVAHFDVPDHLTMNPHNWVPALNSRLPAAIRILQSEEVAPDFHARFSAQEKTYSYLISTDPILSPFQAGRAWHLPRLFNPEDLAEALRFYLGKHDFRAFAAKRGNETEETDYHRTITCSDFEHLPNGARLTFTGDGFLYKMVRLLTGAALQCAQGYYRLDDLYDLVNSPAPDSRSPLAAPADGLTLESVRY